MEFDSRDESFSEMRQESIEHVGQVRVAILEATGNMNFYDFDDHAHLRALRS